MEKLSPFKDDPQEVLNYLVNCNPGVKRIIFDIDGTLLNQEMYVTNRLTFSLISELGFHQSIRRPIEKLVENFGVHQIVDRVISTYSLDRESAKSILLHSLRNPNYKDEPSIVRQGTSSIINELKKSFEISLCTNGNKLQQMNKKNLLSQELFYSIETIYCIDSELKPSPICLENAMGNNFAGDCIFIGDSEIDLLTAKSAGVEFVHVSELLS